MMRSDFQALRRSQRGLSLVEVMVAALIFTVILIASYLLYERGQRSYLQADVAAEQQQNVRYAFDRMVITLRKAGANINPRGDRTLTDEQIEGAWESGIMVRGDFDQSRECGTPPLCSGLDLEGPTSPQHEMISTGNDEILGYVLGKQGANTQTITVNLDLTAPRNAVFSFATPPAPLNEEARTINVAATQVTQQTAPPYTLYQVHFDPNSSDPAAAILTPVAENIFRLRFRYFDLNGVEIPTTSAVPANNLDGTDAKRALRSEIRRIEVQLVGMSSRPDFNYTDPILYTPDIAGAPDPASAKPFRKFVLTERIGSLSLGRKGRDHGPYPTLNLTPPPELRVCKGHCNKFVVTWPSVAGVSSYQVHVEAPAMAPNPAVSERFDVLGTNILIYTAPVPGNTYTFWVRAWEPAYDAFSAFFPGGEPPAGGYGGHTLANNNTPGMVTPPPTGAQDGTNLALRLQWTRPQWNTTPLVMTCSSTLSGPNCCSIPSPKDLEFLDLANFDVHREREAVGANFPVVAAPAVPNNQVDNLAPNSPPGESISFVDRRAAPCQPYYYRVVARDACNVTSLPSDPMAAAVSYDLPAGLFPSAPAALNTSTATTVAPNAANVPVFRVNLSWTEVTTLTDATPIAVSHYVITRERKLFGQPVFSPDPTFPDAAFPPDAWDTLTHYDEAPVQDPVTGLDATYRYTVQAQFDCAVTRTSAPSPELIIPCPTGTTATITQPVTGTNIDTGDVQPITVNVTGTGDRAEVYIRRVDGSLAAPPQIDGTTVTNGNYNFSWDTSGVADGTYSIQSVVYSGTCLVLTGTVTVTVEAFAQCLTLISTGPPAPAPPVVDLRDLNGSSSSRHVTFRLQNNCPTPVSIIAFTPTWVGGSLNNQIDQVDYRINTPSIAETPYGPNPTPPPANFTGLNGERIDFDIGGSDCCPIVIPANGISQLFELRYTKSIIGATWGPFLVHHNLNLPGDDLGAFDHE